MDLTTRPVPTNGDGLAISQHVIAHHRNGQGEATLCGYWIDYDIWRGTAPDANPCHICAELDTEEVLAL